MLERIKHVHFVGIGGAGMSGIAKVLSDLGYKVSGSDLKPTDVTERLEKSGVTIFIGHRKGQMGRADVVVVSTAIPNENEEICEAREKEIPIWPRAKMLGAVMGLQKGIAVAGAHGKTTTTSMISLVLERAGKDPSVVVGGELDDIGGNAKLGKGEYLVAEADESDGSLLNLDPEILVVTNIDDDHLDHYGSLDKILETFQNMINKLDEEDLAVLCIDDENIRSVSGCIKSRTCTYGIHPDANIRAVNIKWLPLGSEFELLKNGHFLGKMRLHVPGIHNVRNSLASLAVCLEAGLSFDQAASAISQFRGVHRRFQLIGEIDGIRVFDDYAHHPSELKATLSAAKLENPGRVIAVFQPHRYTRTKFLQKGFGSAFLDADQIILTDIYSAGEQPIEGIDSQLLEKHIITNGHKNVSFIRDLEQIAQTLASQVQSGDIILTLGAGNIWQVGPALIRELGKEKAVM